MNDAGGDAFKQCSGCPAIWKARDDFLDDGKLDLVGYQPNFKALQEGYFLFVHDVNECLSTISVQAGRFGDLYDGPVFDGRKTGADECPGHCFHKDDLEPCPNECECAYVREILQIIRGRGGRAAAAG